MCLPLSGRGSCVKISLSIARCKYRSCGYLALESSIEENDSITISPERSHNLNRRITVINSSAVIESKEMATKLCCHI